MDTFLIIQFIIIAFCVIIIGSSIKILKENERGVIFRLGRFFKVVGPGIIFIIPFVDKLIIIDLNEKLPGWYNLNENELNEKVKKIIITNKKIIL